mmetsp:Transcript_3366/g.13573  ORF Transcript_3366/g.13573 Transcript_3366/m.13573 type:complete len:363 (+) Transcript_3366:377-1465(+)
MGVVCDHAVRVPAERVHVSVRVGGGGEPEARRGERRFLDPGVVRGVVLQGRVRRGLRLRGVVPVRLAADNHDGTVGKRRSRLVADGNRHGRLVGPGGGAAGDVELEDVFGELVRCEVPGGVVEAADGVALAAGGSTGDVAARLGQRGRGRPGGRRRGRVQDLHGVECLQKVGVPADGVYLGAHGERAVVRTAGDQLGPDGPRVSDGVVDEGGVLHGNGWADGCLTRCAAEGIVDFESADDVNLGADGGSAVAHASDGQRSLGAVVVVDDRIVLANNSHAGAVDVLAADQVDLVADGDGDEVGSPRGQIFFGGPRARALEERARGGVAFERRGLADANHDGLRLDGVIVGVEADVHHERERGR